MVFVILVLVVQQFVGTDHSEQAGPGLLGRSHCNKGGFRAALCETRAGVPSRNTLSFGKDRIRSINTFAKIIPAVKGKVKALHRKS